MLHKYPWFAVDHVTINERAGLFKTTMTLLRVLTAALRKNAQPPMLTRQLLQELVIAALSTPGFNHLQRVSICENVQYFGFADTLQAVPTAHLGVLGSCWAFEVLGKKSEVHMEVVGYYVSLLREATTAPRGFSLAQKSTLGSGFNAPTSPFGNLYVNYGNDKGKLSLAEAAILEWNTVEELLCRVLPSGRGLITQGGRWAS